MYPLQNFCEFIRLWLPGPQPLSDRIDTHRSGVDSGRVLGYDNAHGHHHRHCDGKVETVEFESHENIEKRFDRRSASTAKGGRASPVGKIRIGVEPMDRFFSRMRVKARRLDRGEKLEPGLTVSFEDPADFHYAGSCPDTEGDRWKNGGDLRACRCPLARPFSRQAGCRDARE